MDLKAIVGVKFCFYIRILAQIVADFSNSVQFLFSSLTILTLTTDN